MEWKRFLKVGLRKELKSRHHRAFERDFCYFSDKSTAMQPRFIYVTCKDREEAVRVGKAVVKARLAACANILNGMESIYWWKDELVTDQETVLVFKSRADLVDALIAKVKEVHSYEVPCVVALPILDGNPDYLQWLQDETTDQP
jgi:periplasmic divalent cation tolerance protein